MHHLSHPSDKVAVQVFAFLHAILHLGELNKAQLMIGELCSHREAIFFQRIKKLLDIMIGNLSSPAKTNLVSVNSSTPGI